ncbi:MAG: glycine--tRNA ligase subunit beta, partial [Gammaproteobacteria bacterium]
MQDSLLIELLTEELPPKSLLKLSQAFCRGIFDGLKERGFIADDADYSGSVTEFATPRRLAVLIKDVVSMQPERTVERKGPAVNTAFDKDGKPTPALSGFAKSCNIEIEKLEKQSDKKGEYFVFRAKQPGEALAQHLSDIVQAAIKKLPVAKLMRWGESEVQFVRPVHGLIMLHGANIVPGEVLRLQSRNTTSGHRFLSGGDIVIAKADDYKRELEAQGKVIASFDERRTKVDEQLKAYTQALNARVNPTEGLLDEVTALVEWPVVYVGEFDAEYLAVPQECLILTMQKNQKYFPLLDTSGKLLNKFLIVSNMQVDDPKHIIGGNQRVVRPRLADARFFYNQDRRQTLESCVAKLGSVVYHNKLGTQLQRVERIQKLAVALAERLKEIKFAADVKQVERAAYLCKADLLTDMVGEFPELQGIMGYYYALHDGEDTQVAEAIREHYERVPSGPVGICVGLADKLDTLVGIYGIGLIPTGDKDPFGLRRAALSILRTL